MFYRISGLFFGIFGLIIIVGLFGIVSMILVGVAAGIILLFVRPGQRQTMQQAALPVERLLSEVANGLAYADTYLELLPLSPERTANQRRSQEIAVLCEQAKTAVRTARQPQDFVRAEELLKQAKHDMMALKQFIDRFKGKETIS